MFAAEAKREDGIEAVSIATPNFTHYEIAKAALEAGLHVCCEKPMCFFSNEVQELERLAKEKNRIDEYFHFCARLLKKERNAAPAMIVFCSFEQMGMVAEYGRKHGFKNSYPLFFVKNTSAQVLKVNMRIVGATEHTLVLYRDKLPKFRNDGRMILRKH
jgi:DNA (cytosine-5-)-methyltransferase